MFLYSKQRFGFSSAPISNGGYRYYFIIETIHRVNADDYVRTELRAREDELHVQRTLENEMKRRLERLAEQQQKINEQSSTIADQQSRIASLKALLESK